MLKRYQGNSNGNREVAEVHPGHLAILRCLMARLVFGIPAFQDDENVSGLVQRGRRQR